MASVKHSKVVRPNAGYRPPQGSAVMVVVVVWKWRVMGLNLQSKL